MHKYLKTVFTACAVLYVGITLNEKVRDFVRKNADRFYGILF